MSLESELDSLVEAEIINSEKAEEIRRFLNVKKDSVPNRQLIAFGILGSILVGSGIILIIAHNWDGYSRMVKTIFAFLPMFIGQAACAYALWKQSDNAAWREGASTFLFFGVGACISLVSQVYNLQGEINEFMLTWMLLVLPLLYVMKSGMASLLYLGGITFFALSSIDILSSEGENLHLAYWPLFLAVVPFYSGLVNKRPNSNFTLFHNYLIPISLYFGLTTIVKGDAEIVSLAYVSLFGVFYGVGQMPFFHNKKLRQNPYRIFGALGTVITLLVFSFEWFWIELQEYGSTEIGVHQTPEFLASIILTLIALTFLIYRHKKFAPKEVKPMEVMFLVFMVIFIFGFYSTAAQWLVNLALLALAVLTMREGARQNHLGVLNFGLLILTALIACRFFDSDLSFVIRGMLFLVIGFGFFGANFYMIKRRRKDE